MYGFNSNTHAVLVQQDIKGKEILSHKHEFLTFNILLNKSEPKWIQKLKIKSPSQIFAFLD